MDKKKILREQYGILSGQITERKGGWASLAFQVSTGAEDYFLKVYEKSRVSTPKWTALIDSYIPLVRWFWETELAGRIVLPLVTLSGQNKCEDEENIYILFQYIDGVTIGEQRLTGIQVEQLADITAILHGLREKTGIRFDLLKEDFEVPFGRQLSDFLAKEAGDGDRDVHKLLSPYQAALENLYGKLAESSRTLKMNAPDFVLCHTDIHNWNIMQTAGGLVLLDWEGLKYAPPEADFFSLAEAEYYEKFLEVYRKRHPQYSPDEDSLDFYRMRRKTEDIWEFIEQLTLDTPDTYIREEVLASLRKECTTIP